MIITRWNRLFDTAGSEVELSWSELESLLSTATKFLGGDLHPGWSPAKFEPCKRAIENVVSASALCFDFDKGEAIGDVLERVRGIARGVLHTTRKHREQGQGDRFRVVFPLARAVSAFEFGELWKRVAPAVGSVDPAPKDPSRFWFLPGAVSGAEFHAEGWGGADLDVDSWLRKPDPTLPKPVATASRAERTDIEERARKYIARMDAAVAGSGGHQTTWDVALVLVRGFGLSEDRAYALLCEYNARCQPPWSEKELRHKVKGAAKANKVPSGFLLDRPGEWRTYKSAMPKPPPEDDGFASEPPTGWSDPEEAEREAAIGEAREPGDDTEQVERERREPKSAVERYGVADLRAVCFEVLSNVKSGEKARGHTTGHCDIDSLLCGLRPEMVSLCAAGTSWGKSSWGIMVVDENLKAGVPVLVVGCEDSRMTYGKRIVARRSGVNAMRIRENNCDEGDIKKIEAVAFKAPSEPFFLDCVGKPVEWVAEAVREVCLERGVGVVICDYVQRFRTRKNFGSDRKNQVTYIAELLSDAGKQGKAHTILLSQLKRIEGREPTMDDVKESGDLENMADHVLLGYRLKGGPSRHGEEATVKRYMFVPKNKDGPTHSEKPHVFMPFDLVTASFKTVDGTNSENDADAYLSNYGA